MADKEHTISQLALYLTGPDYTLDKDNVEAIFMVTNALETGNHLVGNAIDIVPLRKDKGSDIDYADKVRAKMKEFIKGKDQILDRLDGDPMHIEFYPNGTRVEKQYNSEITALLKDIQNARRLIIPVRGSQVWIVYGAAELAKPENERNLTREKQKELAALLKKYQPKLLELLDKQGSTKQ